MGEANTAAAQDKRWERFVEKIRSGRPRPFDEHWASFQEIYARRRQEDGPPRVWRPEPERIAGSNLGRLMTARGFRDYRELHAWSVRQREEFWAEVIERLGIVLARRPQRILDPSRGVEDPRWLPGATMSCVESCFRAEPGRPAVVAGGEDRGALTATTYGELEALVNRVANGLMERGFSRGDAVALYMPMTVECVAAYLGIVRAGCRVVSIADSFSPAELDRRCRIGGARGVITVEAYRRSGRPIPLYDKVLEAGTPRTVVIPARRVSDRGGAALRRGDLWWRDFLSGNPSLNSIPDDPYRVTNILFSSGTTADPKAIPWTHLTPIKCAMDGHYHQDIRPGDVVAWPTNIGWMMGPWLIYATLINGATMALYEGAPTGSGFTHFVRRSGVTVLGVVPSLVRAWRSAGAVDVGEWSGVRVFSSTGEPSNREDYLWLMSLSGYRAPIIEYLGGTEIGGGHITGTVVQPASPATFSAPALGIDFLILDEEGRSVPEGESGELYLIPPSVGLSQALLNADHHEAYYAGCPRGPRGEVLRRHGDRFARLAGGFYRAQGRSDDAMNLGGIKVSSLELERVLDDHPAVYESAAVAVQPGGEGAERLVVFAVPKGEPDRDRLAGELQAMIASRLNPLYKIDDLVLVGELPRTASNKLMRRALRAGYAAGRDRGRY
ncbi:MAG: AMP-binding protein [Acidobacteriota bacterium]